jgi:hypothetical protein
VFSRAVRFCGNSGSTNLAESYSCELFVVAKKVNSLAINHIRKISLPGVWGTFASSLHLPWLSAIIAHRFSNPLFS